MPTSEKELEEKLMEFGNRLCSLPSSVDVDDLLPLLDRIEICLSRVEQSPSESLLKRLAPFIKALVADELLRHADVDVRVAVAACISEITRITAPEAPYDDDQMKDVFQLIVSSFERLYDKSSRSYNKRAAILEIVAKVRSCVVMLDLECDELILAMFDHFLKSIRDNHPENVFSSMETIMTLVLEESEEISPELITSILSCLERDKDVLPVAQKLGEKVLENCASKLKPLLVQVMKSLGKSPENYSKVVENICQGTSGDELNSTSFASKNSADESALAKPSEIADGVDSADQVAKEMPLEIVHPEQVPVATNSSPKSIISNGTMQTEVNDSSVGKDPSPVAEHNGQNEPQASMGLGKVEGVDEEKTSSVAKVQPDEEKASSAAESQTKPEKTDKRRGKRSHPSISPAEPSEPHVDSEREEKVLENVEDERDNSVSSAHEELAADAAIPSVNEKESNAPTSTPIILESQALDGDSPSPISTIPDEIQMKKVGRGRKEEKMIPATSVDSDSVAKVQPDEEKASSVAESQPEPEKTDKRRGKRSHPFISPAEPSEPHVDCEREEKVLDNVDDERDTSVSSAHEELAAADAIPSVNEKESNAPTSTPRILESPALDGDSPSPSCTIPDEIQMKKFGRGRKKVKMIPATSVDSDSVAKVQPDEDKASSVAESQPKPEKTDKRRGKRSHPSISPAEPSEPHVDSEREEKVLDNVEDERDNSLSSAHEELAADDAMPSVNEKESNAPTSTPRIPESQALDGDSPSPSCAIPDEIQTNKVGRGRKKGKMITATSVDSDSKKVIEGAIISESKTQKWTGQKAQIAEETSPVPADASNREAGNSKDLDAKLSEQTGKKDKKDDAVVDQLEDRKRRGKGKEPYVNDFLIISLKNDEKKFLSSPKSLAKPSKDESHLEKTTKMNSKRKRAPGKRKASDQSDGDLVGLRISVWWPEDHEFYDGVVDEFDPVEKKHKVTYDDGDVETLVLKDEIWKMADDKLVSLKAHVSDGGSPDASSEMLKGKKRKLTPGPVAKRGRKKRSGVASSSKGKATSSSSTGRKRKGDGKSDTKAKDVRAEDDEKGGKSKDLKDKDSDSPVDNSPKPADDSKFDSIDAIQSSTRAKTDTTKIVGRPKGKTTKSGHKLDSRSAGKLKSGPTKGLEEDAKKSAESAKTPEADRAKSPGLSKAKKSETKSGKKRSRGS